MNKSHFKFRWNKTLSFSIKNPSHAYKLKNLFRAWNEVLIEYESAWREYKNLPYIYNEQAEIGLLAIAARDTKGFPFIEFSIQKHGQGKNYGGRADLEIYWKKKLDWCLGVEAKPANISCSSRRRDKNLVQTIKVPLEEAQKCVNTLRSSYHDRLALVIGKLVHASDDFDRKQLRTDLFSAAWRLKADFCTIHFCEDDIWKNSDYDNCPGIALIGKISGKRGV